MILGITGTRTGTTAAQRIAYVALLHRLNPTVLAHGSCSGADVEAAQIAREELGLDLRIVAHPGPEGPHRTLSGVDDETLAPKNHFARNRDIVTACTVLVAFPPCKPLPSQGGTAYTVGFAEGKRKPVYIIWPDGSVEEPRP